MITAGPVPPQPSVLLSSRRFTNFLDGGRKGFDYVLVDAPSVLPVADAAIVAGEADGVLLVLDARNTRKSAVRESMSILAAVGGNVLGTVMNNVKASKKGSYARKG